MTVQEILNEIDTRYPNTISNAIKIGWMNLILKQIYKHIPSEHTYTFTTVANQALYTLPDYIKIENITNPILITTSDTIIDTDTTFHKYYYAGVIDTIEGNFGNKLSGYRFYSATYNGLNQIGIYPVPTETGLVGKFVYKKYPTTLSEENLSAEPDIQEEWQEILIYECIIKAALSGNNPDTDIANIYIPLRNAIMRDIIDVKYQKEPEYKSTRDVMKRGRFSTYYKYSTSKIRTPYD